MPLQSESPIPDLVNALEKAVTGEVGFDIASRLLYSTDASIYQVEPMGVVFPRTLDELCAAVSIAADYQVPLLARGAGSSLAGQAVGNALVVDCSRHLNSIIEINPAEKTAHVQPGVIMTQLNREASEFDLQFGPDPASAERATMGGSIASNASGAHSILHGMTVDHLLSVEAILSDGSQAAFKTISLKQAYLNAGVDYTAQSSSYRDYAPRTMHHSSQSIESSFYRAALNIRQQYGDHIRQSWPQTWRRASGYNLNYLLSWSPSQPPRWAHAAGDGSRYPDLPDDAINLAALIAGSEGTLAVIKGARVRLVSKPQNTILGLLVYPSLAEACDAVPLLMETGPSAVELISRNLIQLARSVPAYAHQIAFLDELNTNGGDPAALLVIEYAGGGPAELRAKALQLGPDVLIAETPSDQKRIWDVRKVALGILLSRPGEPKPVPFIEDLTVPVENLGQFVRAIERILDDHGTSGDFYGHASAGCLHLRPLLNLKTSRGVADMHTIASESVEACLRLGGAVTGEHGDGLARSEWMQRAYGSQIMAAFRELKQAADPQGILNPQKILDAPSMNTNLRYSPDYRVTHWTPNLDFSRQAGFDGAIELCNGAGVCRKSEGVMCPSFQATADEMHSTRGRANLLRAMISGRFPDDGMAEETVFEALDLCLACKGCKAECPSSVDMAKLKYEFMDHYYGPDAHSHHRRAYRDFLFAYIEPIARLSQPFASWANLILSSKALSVVGERFLGLAHQRQFPRLSPKSMRSLAKKVDFGNVIVERESANRVDIRPADCLFLSDPFTEYFHPGVGLAALEVLNNLGFIVELLPVVGSGRTLLSKGFLDPARRQARKVLEAIKRADPELRLPVLGLEPSEIYTLKDEYLDLLPEDNNARNLAQRAFMVDEFLVRPDDQNDRRLRLMRIATNPNQLKAIKLYLHGHCYQKSQPPAADGYPVGTAATIALLESVGYQVQVIDSGCCGMAGAFGYEAEHYDLSMKVGELALFPAIQDAQAKGEKPVVVAPGVSCQSQIEDGTNIKPVHPIVLIKNALI